jgi:fructose-1,6-bisphosphatase I
MEESKAEIQNNITLTHFILEEESKYPESTGQLSILLHSIEIASKYISSKVRAAGLFRLLGAEGSTNATGDVVKKLDVIANESFITSLKRSRAVTIMVSEENEKVVTVDDQSGHYCAVFDPLDGSSNIDANVSIGTIFGIYKKNSKGEPSTEKDVLQPGSKLVAAGYTMYGSATLLVLTTGKGVNMFTFDPTSGEFVLSHANVKTPAKKNIYSINEGYSKFWHEPLKKYINHIKDPKTDKDIYSQRYVGSMVADVHRTILYGGIFMYPADTRTKDGKLRLLYEANPMAFIVEQAGGKATTGTHRILEIQPTSIHQRVPVFLGSTQNVEELESFYKSG